MLLLSGFSAKNLAKFPILFTIYATTMRLRNIRDGLNICLSRGRFIVGNRSSATELTQFFRKLKPQSTEHRLIRVGGEDDGGYLVPNDLEGITTLFSPGVGRKSEFELFFANRGVECFLADRSVDAPPVEHPNFKFVKKFLGTENNEVFMTLQHWVNQSEPRSGDMMLQMDIERSEFGVLLHTDISILKRFRVIVIEFHSMADLYQKLGLELISHSMDKLLAEFVPVHLHPNNANKAIQWKNFSVPPLMEITFLRKDRVKTLRPTTQFPHELDRPCVPSREDYPLPECWYNS